MPKIAKVMPQTVRMTEDTYMLMHDACTRTGENSNWITNRVIQMVLGGEWPGWITEIEREYSRRSDDDRRPTPENRFVANLGNGLHPL